MSDSDPRAEHTRREKRWADEVARLEGSASRLSLGRLVLFLVVIVLAGTGFSQDDALSLGGAGLATAAFFALVLLHGRTLAARDRAEAHRAVHARHLKRLDGAWTELPPSGKAPPGHAYAGDIDLLGAGSLAQRIDVTHTVRGEATLGAWLGGPADDATLRARQEAVRELAADLDFREHLEAAAGRVGGEGKLDPSPFLSFTAREPFVLGSPLAILIHVSPLVVLGLWIAGGIGALPGWAWLAALGAQSLLALGLASRAVDAFQLIAARRGYVEAFQSMLVQVERARFESPLLRRLQERLSIGEGERARPPSAYMARLDRWAGFAEFHTQFPIHFVVNLATLYDLHVLLRLERWNADVGQGLDDAFTALGELEALASLATLLHGDPDARLPELVAEPVPFEAEALAHPLLAPGERVANDVRMPAAEGAALIVTGSNMAGKSTLLRAVGLNVALALAGGPVVAKRLRLARVRLRASMRVDDSLQQGASYFHAELTKLRSVVEGADEAPPLFFLLDELLRGTNARARHVGARAILEHLLARRACGLAATHDIALAKLADEHPGRVENVHFTDVMRDGEMIFDYRLQPGVVKTSNALRLLEMAGIEVEVDDALPALDGPPGA
ncbi:MAG: DNA mismatch repair protein MutS [Sandaracinus sp.]|nr:DNA mismatch repair protein MutS [Sandaracinus sp.]